ncbi:hypothetical protein HD806DRAFT_517201 [Xylariaceae sp. AK1471]|nr:hypothetical protein HD806DRAFT_517201 [Xylariaceae sp. AK1471]
MSSSQILAPLDAADLERHGLLSPPNSSGSRRIHKRRLNSSSDEEHHEISLDVSVSSNDASASGAFAVIPEVLISRETLLYVGFSETKATELWDEWTNWPSFGPRREIDADDGGLQVDFVDFITGTFDGRIDAIEDSDSQWRACLHASGVDIPTQDAIMDVHFHDIRHSQSCLYWAKDTVQMRYAGLEEIQRASLHRQMAMQRFMSRPSGSRQAHGSRETDRGPDTRADPSSSSSTAQNRQSVSAPQQQMTPGIATKTWGSASAIAARNVPGHTVLFKAIDQGRISGLFDESGALHRIDTLLSPGPTDFSGTRSLFYFTPDYKLAQYYAAYAKRRANTESIVIICFPIPNSSIESLSAPDIYRVFWPSAEWKELVWRSRTRATLPTHVRKYRNAILKIGTISRKPNHVYHLLESWEDVTEAYVLRVPVAGQGNPAIQYVFSGEDEGREFLLNHGAQDMKVFPYPYSELVTWPEDNQGV